MRGLKSIKKQIDKMNDYEKNIDLNIKKIMNLTDDTINKNSFKCWIELMRSLQSVQQPILGFMELCKESLFSVFSDALLWKLLEVAKQGERKAKYDPNSDSIHPVFTSKFKIYSIVAQDEETVYKIEDDFERKIKIVDEVENVRI